MFTSRNTAELPPLTSMHVCVCAHTQRHWKMLTMRLHWQGFLGKRKNIFLSFSCFDMENGGELVLCIYTDSQGRQLEVAFPQVTQAEKDGRRWHKLRAQDLGYKEFTQISKGGTWGAIISFQKPLSPVCTIKLYLTEGTAAQAALCARWVSHKQPQGTAPLLRTSLVQGNCVTESLGTACALAATGDKSSSPSETPVQAGTEGDTRDSFTPTKPHHHQLHTELQQWCKTEMRGQHRDVTQPLSKGDIYSTFWES